MSFQVNIGTMALAIERALAKADMEATNTGAIYEKERINNELKSLAKGLSFVLEKYKPNKETGYVENSSKPVERNTSPSGGGDHADGDTEGNKRESSGVQEQEPEGRKEGSPVHTGIKSPKGKWW
jgi:hypothetical protein